MLGEDFEENFIKGKKRPARKLGSIEFACADDRVVEEHKGARGGK